MRRNLYIIILSICFNTNAFFCQNFISGWFDLEVISWRVEQIKNLNLDAKWDTLLSLKHSKKGLYAGIEVKDKLYQILLIPDLNIQKTTNSNLKPVFKGKELSRNNNLGSWDLYINGSQIADIEIKAFENGQIIEYLISCSKDVIKNRNYSRDRNRYDNFKLQYSGDFWAYSWEGDFYVGENPSISKNSTVRCQIFYHNGDIFYGFVNKGFNLVGEGKYVFKSHPKYLEYKGYFFNSKFDDSNHPSLPQAYSTLTFKDGKVINGSFLSGNINVNKESCIIYPNGDTYCGTVSTEFLRNGKGEIRYKNGGGYQGNWSNDFESGVGKVVYKDGTVIEGVWDKKRLIDLHDKITLHGILPKEAQKNLRIYKSNLGDFEHQPKQYSFKPDFQQKLMNENLVEVVEWIEDKNIYSKLIDVKNERVGADERQYIKTIYLHCGPSIGRYVAKIEKNKSNFLMIKLIEIHQNDLLNYTLIGNSIDSKINNNGELEGPWEVQTKLGYNYNVELRNGKIMQLLIDDNIVYYNVKQVLIDNSKVFQGTFKWINSKQNETLVYQAIWDNFSGTKILQGLHLLNGDTLYFGNYENDKRQGYGISILKRKEFQEKGYYKYRGQWCNDMICGAGEMLLKGNKWKNGYWLESKEIEISLSRLPQKFELRYKSFNNHLSTFKITGSQIEVIDKDVEKRAISPSINLMNTSAIQRSNGVVNAAIIVPRKTGYISFQEFNCNRIIYEIKWSDGTIDELYLDFNFRIIGIS